MTPGSIEGWKTRDGQTQVIGQAEVFPVLVARLTWAKHLVNRRVIYFIDNESARLALIKGYSPVLPTLDILMEVLGWDFDKQSFPWYSRVPTASNIGDGPSRMSLDGFPEGGRPQVVAPVFPVGYEASVVLV